jgi:hypothetical protein
MSHKIAQLLLDFAAIGSVCGAAGGAAMDPATVEATIKVYLTEMRSRFEKATSIAKAAEACALSGNVEKGIEIVLDIEQITYEVNTFLNAASMIHRFGSS